MPPNVIDPRMRDFRNFVFVVWAHLNLPAPTKIQYDIAHYLQHGPRRRIIQAFRGVGKSWLTAAFVLWRLYLNPNERVLVVSASKDRADAFSTFVRRLISEVDVLKHLEPDPTKGHRDSMLSFDVGPSDAHQAPSVRSVGIQGQLTGGRATIIVADDVESPKNSLTMLMRERLAELVKEFDAVLTPGGEVIVLGTPQVEESVYSKLAERGYSVRIWPARYPDGQWLLHYGDRVAPVIRASLDADRSLEGRSTDPARFSDEDLLERALSYGKAGFALQFQLDTRMADADRYPLRLSDLIVMAVDPRMAPLKVVWGSGRDRELPLPSVGLRGDRLNSPMFVHEDFSEYTGCVMFIDPSGRGADETAYAVVKVLNATLYLVDVGGFTDGYSDEVLSELAEVAKRNEVKLVLIEPNFGDGMFNKLIAPHFTRIYPCRIEDSERATTQKERRIIDTLEPVLNQHRLVVAESVVKKDFLVEDPHRQMLYQLTRITRDKGALRHYDRLDAVAGAVAYWVDALATSADTAAARTSDRLRDRELKKFMSQVVGQQAVKRGRVARQFMV